MPSPRQRPFREDRPSSFGRAALGEPLHVPYVAVQLEEELLPSGSRVLVAAPSDGIVQRSVVLAASMRGFTGMYTELCLRLAQRHRWAVAAPEPYPDSGDLDLKSKEHAAAAVSESAVLGDLIAAADRLGSGPTSLIGFCLGGMHAYKASAEARFVSIVSFYGMVRLPPGRAGQREPLECLAERRSPVLAIVGSLDELITADDRRALESVGVELCVYREAGHAFAHDPSLPGYRADDATDAWQRTASWLARHDQSTPRPIKDKE